MKFLCVACDEPMKLTRTGPPDAGGSLTVLYACPSCGQQTAMLTNPYETQLVQSLGVKIGPVSTEGVAAGATEGAGEQAGGCPFSGMLQEMEERQRQEDGLTWTAEALARLEGIPDFVRPMAKQGIEHYAKSEGRSTVDRKTLDEARERFGM
jgi:hypothetical protein